MTGNNKTSWMKIVIVCIFAGMLGIGYKWYSKRTMVVQPIQFNHLKHNKLSCEICHPGILKKAKAGLPSISLCANCHATSPDLSETGKKWWIYFLNKDPEIVPWQPLYSVPKHAYFSHRRHLSIASKEKLLSCPVCHGDIHKTERIPQKRLVNFSMEKCRRCHRYWKVSTDCTACHR
ncbi:MAG: hypothetical protein D6808_06600 [Candidatus Dadabacteria bacterium]|nr:MAG: hypothetical protein D6808_06600 [Candidatus Dadabacteria bacterium]